MKQLLTDGRGANLAEYLIFVGVLAIIAVVGFRALGHEEPRGELEPLNVLEHLTGGS
ncbi:MAG TPA: hypothetical protein VFS43_39135 [Polyangiaceae bacterium]|nr:hypothetical protein [Polyangiaceae bacterium]